MLCCDPPVKKKKSCLYMSNLLSVLDVLHVFRTIRTFVSSRDMVRLGGCNRRCLMYRQYVFELNFRGKTNVRHLNKYLWSFANLKHLSVSSCNLKLSWVRQLQRKVPFLQELNVSHNDLWEEYRSEPSLLPEYPFPHSLKKLNIANTGLGSIEFETTKDRDWHLLPPCLVTLQASSNRLKNDHLVRWVWPTSLRSLSVANNLLTGLEDLLNGQLQKLVTLDCRDNNGLHPDVQKCNQLQTFEFTVNNRFISQEQNNRLMTHKRAYIMRSLNPTLTFLNISKCPKGFSFGDIDFPETLRRLKLTRNHLNTDTMKGFRLPSRLQILDLSYNWITTQTLNNMIEWPSQKTLHTLLLANNLVSFFDMMTLNDLVLPMSLKKLDLSNNWCRLTRDYRLFPDGLEYLSLSSNLMFVSPARVRPPPTIVFPKALKYLNLSNCCLADNDMHRIVDMLPPSLKHIVLNDNRISNENNCLSRLPTSLISLHLRENLLRFTFKTQRFPQQLQQLHLFGKMTPSLVNLYLEAPDKKHLRRILLSIKYLEKLTLSERPKYDQEIKQLLGLQ